MSYALKCEVRYKTWPVVVVNRLIAVLASTYAICQRHH